MKLHTKFIFIGHRRKFAVCIE